MNNDLLGPMLRDVSRSFYVSIKLLPKQLRRPVGIAYLLARATDTLADTPQIAADVRSKGLRDLAGALQGAGGSDVVIHLIKSFAPQQTNESERTLLQALPECLLELEKLDAADQNDVREVLSTINRGQALDIDRPMLKTAAELTEYTYLVAGCVGEFWTRLCFRHLAQFAELSQVEMSELGTRYGQGLQLINILRDAATDLKNGRCYFPEEELSGAGISASEILASPRPFMPIFRKWLGAAEEGLEAGMKYVDAINNRRVRAATVLPALIGAKTIAMMKAADSDVLRAKVKVPRSDVRTILGTVAMSLANRGKLQSMFRDYSR